MVRRRGSAAASPGVMASACNSCNAWDGPSEVSRSGGPLSSRWQVAMTLKYPEMYTSNLEYLQLGLGPGVGRQSLTKSQAPLCWFIALKMYPRKPLFMRRCNDCWCGNRGTLPQGILCCSCIEVLLEGGPGLSLWIPALKPHFYLQKTFRDPYPISGAIVS